MHRLPLFKISVNLPAVNFALLLNSRLSYTLRKCVPECNLHFKISSCNVEKSSILGQQVIFY